jgi:hypothetical protein
MAITKTQVRARLKSAKNAAERLQDDVKWLVSNRAWETLGYANFSEMWEKENGFGVPPFVKVLVVCDLADEGMNTDKSNVNVNGHTSRSIQELSGVYGDYSRGYNSEISRVIQQYTSGIPKENIRPGSRYHKQVIQAKTHRRRAQPRRMGKLPNELINAGWSVYKYQADAVKEIARKAGVPDSVVVRSALDMYLNRNQKDVG